MGAQTHGQTPRIGSFGWAKIIFHIRQILVRVVHLSPDVRAAHAGMLLIRLCTLSQVLPQGTRRAKLAVICLPKIIEKIRTQRNFKMEMKIGKIAPIGGNATLMS